MRDDSTDNFELFVHKKYRTYTNLSPWLFYNGGLASLVGNSAAAMSSNSITSTASQQQWLHVDFILCRCCTQPSTQKKIYMVGYSRSILNQIVKKDWLWLTMEIFSCGPVPCVPFSWQIKRVISWFCAIFLQTNFTVPKSNEYLGWDWVFKCLVGTGHCINVEWLLT